MDSILGEDECLYEVLGLQKGSSLPQIAKAYKKQALKYHPDRNNGDDTMFKKVGYVYAVLKDEGKKKYYDQTGRVHEGGLDADNLNDLVKMMFQQVTKEQVENFSTGYKNSEEERESIIEAYNTHSGDFYQLREDIYFQAVDLDEEKRICRVIAKLIDDKVLERTTEWTQTSPLSPANRKKKSYEEYRATVEEEAAEVEQLEKMTAQATKGNKSDVQVALKELMQDEFNSMFTTLAQKYGMGDDNDDGDDGIPEFTDEQFEAAKQRLSTSKQRPSTSKKPSMKRSVDNDANPTPPKKKRVSVARKRKSTGSKNNN
eukprot:TRINITY_DN4219_c5_g1_i1.p1 TRINITY_DN4219_c5_g1~~TRINITY_DN4219_c5_g1_i1.p1  ORF type:complete len:315 (+),score=90.14 TRINITY_DN4219_c5_g1_i1:51-995(+)